MKELTEAASVAAFRARYEAGRSFDLDDDLEFCPALLTQDDVRRLRRPPLPSSPRLDPDRTWNRSTDVDALFSYMTCRPRRHPIDHRSRVILPTRHQCPIRSNRHPPSRHLLRA